MSTKESLHTCTDENQKWKRLALVHIIYAGQNPTLTSDRIESTLENALGPEWKTVALTALAEGEICLPKNHEEP